MNLKRLTLVAALAVTQAVSAVPAFADPVAPAVSPAPSASTLPSASTEATPSPAAPGATAIPGQVTGQQNTATPVPTAIPGEVTGVPSATPIPTDGTFDPYATPLPTDGTMAPTETQSPTLQPASQPAGQPAIQAGPNQLILLYNSNKMYMNGKEYLAGQPMAVKNGVSYVAIRAMVERVGLQFRYDYQTKETIIMKDGKELRFKTDSKIYTVNGVPTTMKGPAYQFKNTFMVPLTSITQALGIKYSVDNINKRIIMTLGEKSKPKASFSIPSGDIFAGQTIVNYVTNNTLPSGTQLANEEWVGRQEIYDQPGFYTITYRVQDTNGQWSDPFSVTIEVKQPNQPPVASFMTDKDEYKMGELITLTDQSSDPDGDKLTYEWTNRALAFFNPGPVNIQLKVSDGHGHTSTFEKTINITSEQLYNEADFYKLFTPIGDSFDFDGGQVPAWNKLTYNTSSEPVRLIRANSPEKVNQEGVVYRESAMGMTRIMVHHVNNTATNKKIYVLATNNNSYPTKITTNYSGFAGPSLYAEATGQQSLLRYFDSMVKGDKYSEITLQPGQTIPILTDLSNATIKPQHVVSLTSDLTSDYNIDYNVIMIDSTKDPIATLPTLPVLDRDGVHNRGTYNDANRLIQVNDVVGTAPVRLVLGSNADDPNLVGFDPMAGTEASNAGNFGVLYKIRLERVAPNTLITFNPRGGNYMGPVWVNGTVVGMPNVGSLKTSNQNSVVFRSGDFEGPVEIMFTAASGSNLPVNFLIQPLPAKK